MATVEQQRTFMWNLGIFALATIMDITTTHIGTTNGMPELNPIVSTVLNTGGTPGLVIAEAIRLSILAYVTNSLFKENPHTTVALMRGGNLLNTGVVISNTLAILVALKR